LGTGNVIDRRIAAIKQQITSRPNLIELINRYRLYPDERDRAPLSDLVTKMRSSISLVPSRVPLAGRAGESTVSFRLSFEYPQPNQAQAVAQDLMDRILQLDARGNSEQATNTEQFLTDQASGLETQIKSVQDQIAQVSIRNAGVLSNGGMIVSDNSGSYDVQIAALQHDNQQLLQQRQLAQTSDTRDPVVVAAEQRLASARAIYSDDNPDVLRAEQELAEAKKLAASKTKKLQNLPVESIDQQIEYNNSQISRLRAAKDRALAQMNSRLAAQSKAPLVQQELDNLRQKLSALNSQYQGVQNKLMGAKSSVRAEDEQLAEKLSVVEPPVVPDKPSWPDRLLLAAVGVGGGLGFGFILAMGIEILLRPIRDPETIKEVFGSAPIGIIPIVQVRKSKRRGWRKLIPLR
jgi:uncharacterized protein involved in exopolysaccharide biosynthesis